MRSHPDGPAADDGTVNTDGNSADDDRNPAVPVQAIYMDGGPAPLEQALLKKYIMYAKAFTNPVLQVRTAVASISIVFIF